MAKLNIEGFQKDRVYWEVVGMLEPFYKRQGRACMENGMDMTVPSIPFINTYKFRHKPFGLMESSCMGMQGSTRELVQKWLCKILDMSEEHHYAHLTGVQMLYSIAFCPIVDLVHVEPETGTLLLYWEPVGFFGYVLGCPIFNSTPHPVFMKSPSELLHLSVMKTMMEFAACMAQVTVSIKDNLFFDWLHRNTHHKKIDTGKKKNRLRVQVLAAEQREAIQVVVYMEEFLPNLRAIMLREYYDLTLGENEMRQMADGRDLRIYDPSYSQYQMMRNSEAMVEKSGFPFIDKGLLKVVEPIEINAVFEKGSFNTRIKAHSNTLTSHMIRRCEHMLKIMPEKNAKRIQIALDLFRGNRIANDAGMTTLINEVILTVGFMTSDVFSKLMFESRFVRNSSPHLVESFSYEHLIGLYFTDAPVKPVKEAQVAQSEYDEDDNEVEGDEDTEDGEEDDELFAMLQRAKSEGLING